MSKFKSLKWLSKLFHRLSRAKTFALPHIISPYLALVRVTLSLLGFVKNPIPIPSLERTHEIIIKSFSRP